MNPPNQFHAQKDGTEIIPSYLVITSRLKKPPCKGGAKVFPACLLSLEAVARRCSVKIVFLKISQNSQETSAQHLPLTLLKKEALAQEFYCEFWKIFKNTFSYRTPPVTASASRLASCINSSSYNKQGRTLTLKRLGGGINLTPCGFYINVFSRERAKPCFLWLLILS